MKIIPNKEEEYQKIKKDIASNAYASAIVRFAEEWAFEMERLLKAGSFVFEIADETCSLVDKRPGFGITGYMYGNAVNLLAEFWEHGVELRRWHNMKYGAGPEQEKVVNPAIVTIGE